MKNFILALAAIFCFGLTSYAQDSKKIQKNIKDAITAITANNLIIDSLNREKEKLAAEYNQKNDTVAKFTTRKFVRSNSEEALQKHLSNTYASLANMLADESLKGKLESYPNSSLARTYLRVIEMNQSLHQVYNKAKNNDYKVSIDSITTGLLEQHRAEFKDLASNIKDYRFVVFELARVFKIIDTMKGNDSASIRSKLRDEKETEYIDKIACAKEAIINYLIPENRIEIKEEWRKVCPEAFSDN